MKFAAAVVALTLCACAGVDVPDGAASMENWSELNDARQEWADRGLPNVGNCAVPYVVVVSTDEFEAHYRELGSDPTRQSCSRAKVAHCVDLYTDIGIDRPSVIYVDAARNLLETSDREGALHHELFHILRQCHEGSPDQLHADHAVWSGDVWANN